ncbi:MAG: hypothetical protein IKH88_06745, partial [Prevotella sp.]|nr:hypothetical protein [Prevotella sp.]
DDFIGLQILILFPSGLQIPMNILGADNDDSSGLQILILFPSGLQIPMNILGAKQKNGVWVRLLPLQGDCYISHMDSQGVALG